MFVLPSVCILIENLHKDFRDANDDVNGGPDGENQSEALHDLKLVILTLNLQIGESSEQR